MNNMETAISNWVPGQILVGVIVVLVWSLIHMGKGIFTKIADKLEKMDHKLNEIDLKFSNVVNVEEHTKSVSKIWDEINRIRERVVVVEAKNDLHIHSAQQ